MGSRQSAWTQAFAVVRLDDFGSPKIGFEEGEGPNTGAGGYTVTVKEVVLSREEAVRETRRLNSLNADIGTRYYWQATHLFNDGGSFGSAPGESHNPPLQPTGSAGG